MRTNPIPALLSLKTLAGLNSWKTPPLWGVFVALLLVIGIAIIANDVRLTREQSAALFFSEALAREHIDETITLQGKEYRIRDGQVASVEGAQPNRRDTFAALQLAYAVTLARYSPLLAIPGTDLDALVRNTKALADMQEKLASIQSNQRDADLIRQSLYPITFLKALAHAEYARQAFIKSASDRDEKRYRATLAPVIAAFRKDLSSYEHALKKAARERKIGVMDGIVSKESIERGVNEAARGIRATETRLTERARCLSGDIALCDARDVRFPDVYTPGVKSADHEPSISNEIPAVVQQTLTLLAKANDLPPPEQSYLIVTDNDTCTKNIVLPRYFIAQSPLSAPEKEPTYNRIVFAGDLFFYPMSPPFPRGWQATMQYFFDRGVTFLPYTPTHFYLCPGVAGLFGHLFAIAAITDALKQGASPASFDPRLPLRDDDILRLLHDRIQKQLGEDASYSKLHQLATLALAAKNGSANFEWTVMHILRKDSALFHLRQVGDTEAGDPEYLLTVKSGFPALFQTHNPSVIRGIEVSTLDPVPIQKLSSLVQYSKLEGATEKNLAAKAFFMYKQIHQTWLTEDASN